MGRRPYLFLSLLVLGLFVLTNCRFLPGRSNEQTNRTSPSRSASVVRDNALTLQGDDPPTLDPALASDEGSASFIVEIFSGLVTINKDLQVVPDIAEKWDISSDGTVYTFRLRDASFHSGKKITANDFKFAMERSLDPRTQSTVADLYLDDIVGAKEMLTGRQRSARGIKVVDEKTLEITIDAPKSYFISKLTYPTAFAVNQENIQSGGRAWAQKPDGSGPFKLAQYREGELIVLERNDTFYGEKAKLQRVNFLLAGGAGVTQYENDELDISGISLADLDRINDPNGPLSKQKIEFDRFSVFYFGFNVKKPPFDDVKVRQAFNHAIDKERVNQVVIRELGRTAYGILPPGFPGYNDKLQGLKFDPQKAKQLLAESKYSDISRMPPVTLTASGQGAAAPRTTQAILEMLKQNLGIDVKIEQVEYATYLNDLKRKEMQMFNIGWIADYLDPQDFLDILLHSESSNNYGNYANPEFDRLVEQARTERDQQRRFALYQQAEQIAINDAIWIPMWFDKGYLLVKPHVKDYVPPPLVLPHLARVSIQK
jgi:oligopeptide transport system substrate-binding protein